MTMQYHRLGNTGLQISEIGFGCMSLKPDQPDAISILQQAADGGINFFDTADLYDKGANEALVGKAFRHKRSSVVIATKVGNQWKSDGSGWAWNPHKTYILSAVEESLRRLQTDYIDLYQLHGGTIDDPMEETVEAFEQLKAEGKIRHYGISSLRPNVIRRWAAQAGLSSVMIPYSLPDRRAEESVFPLLQQNGIGVLARGPLAQGLLAGKEARDYLDHKAAEVKKMQRQLARIAGSAERQAGVALRFALGHPAVTAAVTGIRSSTQLAEALMTTGTTLRETDYAQLQNTFPAGSFKAHR